MSDVGINGNNPKFSEMEYKPVRNFWPNEASNFTPWLLENSDYLAKALGIDLELDKNEHPVGLFSLDLFGRDLTHGCPLIVENQLEKTDHTHLGQLLTYAAGTDAKTVVWISTKFRDEHRQALEYLNNLAGDTTRFFGIEVKVAVIADSLPAPILSVVAQPSGWRTLVKAQQASVSPSTPQAAYLSFWSDYLDRVSEDYPDLTNARSTTKSNWIDINSYRGVRITLGFIKNSKLVCDLNINSESREKNMMIFDALKSQKAEIEEKLGVDLLWEPMEDKIQCRLRLERQGIIKAEPFWPEFIEWLLKWNVAFKQVFFPLLEDLGEPY